MSQSADGYLAEIRQLLDTYERILKRLERMGHLPSEQAERQEVRQCEAGMPPPANRVTGVLCACITCLCLFARRCAVNHVSREHKEEFHHCKNELPDSHQ